MSSRFHLIEVESARTEFSFETLSFELTRPNYVNRAGEQGDRLQLHTQLVNVK